MTLPTVDAFATMWPTATIEVFVGHHSRAAFEFRPTLTLRTIPDSLDLNAALQLSRVLRQGGFDLVVNLDRSRWLRIATTVSRAPWKAAVTPMRPERRHESEVYLDIARSLGVPTPFVAPSISPSEAAEREATNLLGDPGLPYVVLHPGGAQNPGVAMLDKRWPAPRFIKLARALRNDGIEMLLSGGPSDIELAKRIAEGAGIPERHVLAGRVDIATIAAILQRATAYVGPDTGISHIAAAVGTPTIAIFGPTNPRRYRPLGRDVQVLAPAESWSIPDRDLRRAHPMDGSVSTERVTIDAVLEATHRAISRGIEPRTCHV